MTTSTTFDRPQPATATRISSEKWALASLSLSMLLAALGTSIANVALPTLAHAFTASFQQVQWVVLAYLLAITTLIVSAGRLGDLLGRRRLLLAGTFLFTTASLLCGLAPTLPLLIAARAAQGLGAAVMMALTMAFVGETVPKEKTGSAMGLLGTMSAIGTALGPSLGGVLIARLGWPSIFFISVPLGILTLLLAQRYLPPSSGEAVMPSVWSAVTRVTALTASVRAAIRGWCDLATWHERRLDLLASGRTKTVKAVTRVTALQKQQRPPGRSIPSQPPSVERGTRVGGDAQPAPQAFGARTALHTLLLALTLGAYALAVTTGRGTFGAINMLLLFGAVAGLALFVLAESKTTSPLIQLAMFRNPVLSAGFAMSALVTTVVMATLVVGPFYLTGALGLDAAGVGLAMSTGPLVAALTGVPAGRLVDRFGASRMTIAGLLAMAAGASILPMVPVTFGVAGYITPLIAVTTGYALFQAANNTAVMADIRPDRRGVVSGMLNLSRNLGLVTGASVMGAVFALGSGATSIMTARPEAVAAGMRVTFAVAAILIVAALAIAAASRALSRRANTPPIHEE